VHIAYADTVEELQRKIEERSRNIEQLNKEIQTYSELADKTSKEALSLQKVIKDLEQNAKIMDLDIKRLRQKIDVANLDIQKLDIHIDESEKKIETLQEGIESSVRSIQRSESFSLIENFLGQRNLTDFLSEIDNQLSFNNAMQTRIMSLRNEKQKLETNKTAKETTKKDLVKMQTELSDKKKVVEYTKSEQNKALKETKNQEKAFQQILKDKLAQKAAFEKEVFEYESKIKYTLNPSSIPQAGSILSWPVDNVRITQRFGKSVAAKRLYVSGSHNGVDFGVPIGTRVKAASGGTVLGVGDTDLACRGVSFGRWVYIRHDNGLGSIYAHLSVISAKEGQRVETGDVIGYSGNTGYSTGPHLHLSVYAADAVKVENRPSISCRGKVLRMPIAPIEAYLDPMVYLPAL
jgi:murein DD-endopeptidase MepM/ murein hydrolase activator NlpD